MASRLFGTSGAQPVAHLQKPVPRSDGPLASGSYMWQRAQFLPRVDGDDGPPMSGVLDGVLDSP